MVSDADIALQLLEIVALFLPLIAIFSQFAIRVVSREETALGARRSELLLQGVLVTLVSLVLAGGAAAGVVYPSTESVLVRLSVIAVGYAIPGLAATALATVIGFSTVLASAANAEDTTATDGAQQRLTRWETELQSEEAESDGDG